MKRNNIFNLTIGKIKNLNVDWEKAENNKHLFSSNSNFPHTLNIIKSVADGYNTFFFRISKKGIDYIDFASDYDMTTYKFNEFFTGEQSSADVLIQEEFLKLINKLIYLGVLYGTSDDFKVKVIAGNHFGNNKTYYWICDIDNVEVGDIAIVESQDEYKPVEIVKVVLVDKDSVEKLKPVIKIAKYSDIVKFANK